MIARVLQAEDLSALIALRLEGIRRYPEAFLLTEAEALAAPDARLLGWITSGGAHGVFDGKTLIGFAGLDQRPWDMARHRAHIGPFYVTTDHHGTGAAVTLMAHLEDTARAQGVRQLELWVAAENSPAIHFYAKRGFRRFGKMPGAVILEGRARDDLFMVQDLTHETAVPGSDGLRRLTSSDWRAFRTIRLEMLEEAPEFFGSTHAEWAAKTPDQIMAWLSAMHLFAQVSGGRVLATAAWYRKPGAVQAHRAGVIAVYTTPEARGRGLATKLLSALEADARDNGITQFELSVGDNNPAARAAYAASGYKLIGTIPQALSYSGTLVDQHEMVKPLTA